MPPLVTSYSLLTPLLLLFLGAGQMGLWRMWPKHLSLMWMGSAFVSLSVAIAVQMLWRPAALLALVGVFSACYLLGFACMGKALACRMKVRFDTPAALALCVLCMGLQIWCTVGAPSLSARVYILNLAGMAIFGLPLLYWRLMRVHSIFDQVLRWVFVLYILTGVIRLMVLLPQSQGAQHEDFTQTSFWLGVHVVCMALGMLAASAMFFAVLEEVLEKLHTDSNMDALTEVLNRRGWDARLQKLQQLEAADAAQSYALLLVDLDHFKSINDTLGHAAGDRVLMQTARLLKRQVRGHDLVCRHGGEEFIVLLVGATLHIAQQVAERICKQMQTLDLPLLQGQPVTMSIGVASLRSLQPADMAQAMEAADQQLYAAKREGRNRVAVQSIEKEELLAQVQ